MSLSSSQAETQRIAQTINRHMNFATQATATATQSLLPSFLGTGSAGGKTQNDHFREMLRHAKHHKGMAAKTILFDS